MLQALIEGAILAVIMIALGNVSITYILFPVTLVFLALFSMGIGLFVSVFNVFYRDVGYLVGIGMQVLFYATPIIYPLSIVRRAGPLPAFVLNPLTQFVEWCRDAFYNLTWPSFASFSLTARRRASHVRGRLGRVQHQGPQHRGGAVSEPAIVVEDIWKRFRVYQERPNSLKERITKFSRDRYEEFWALKGVSVTVPHGTVYGLVGHNGSGKSSMLRIMAGIHRPTKGTVTTHGRISALLELGAGFHPDLSGRENIYLNAAILGSVEEGDRATSTARSWSSPVSATSSTRR